MLRTLNLRWPDAGYAGVQGTLEWKTRTLFESGSARVFHSSVPSPREARSGQPVVVRSG